MLFPIIVATILGLLNFYVYRSLAPGTNGHEGLLLATIAFCFASLFAAVYLERMRRYRASIAFSWIGYTWLGIMGISATLAFALDAAQLVFPEALSDERGAALNAGLTLTAAAWGAVAARRPRRRRIALTSPKLGEPFSEDRPLRLVQISDLHLGDSAIPSRIVAIVKMVNDLEPDIIVSTGDLFDGHLALMPPFAAQLSALRAPLGKFAVSGNHEVYAGLEEALQLTRAAGFEPLRNAAAAVGGSVVLAGVEDPAAPNGSRERDALAAVPAGRFTVLLKHRPLFEPQSKGKFDLQLSGHTHGGQIFPFWLFTKLQYRARVGLSTVAPGQQLYLSRGAGCWGPQIRLFAPPEIALFLIRPAKRELTAATPER